MRVLEIDGTPYIVMEYVEGRTLAELLATEGPLSPQRAVETVVQVCDALEYAHRHRVIHRVAVLKTPGSPAPDPAAAGVHHIAYTYAGLGELLATYRRLKARGIEPARCINHGPTTSMYYRDPDGLRVELQIDNFATMDEAHAYFTGPDFAQNPIGVIFDPEHLIRDYEAGLAFDDLVRRPPLPPGKTPMDMRAER